MSPTCSQLSGTYGLGNQERARSIPSEQAAREESWTTSGRSLEPDGRASTSKLTPKGRRTVDVNDHWNNLNRTLAEFGNEAMQKVVDHQPEWHRDQLEEPGFNQLGDYLERAEARLKDSPDRTDVMDDLEQAVGGNALAFRPVTRPW